MPATLLAIRTDARSRLDEPSARYWSDAELNTWINEACRDIARRAEVIRNIVTSIPVFPGQSNYVMPLDLVRIHRVEFQTTGVQPNIYLLEGRTREEMDQYWGWLQQRQASYPYIFVEWGFVGGAGSNQYQIQLYPVPSQGGTLNVYYYRLPATMSLDSDTADIPEGWQDIVALYCEYVAKRKERDPSWQEARQIYEDQLQHLVEVTRNLYEASQGMITPRGMMPSWLYGSDDYYW
jgi:hypothetical protein